MWAGTLGRISISGEGLRRAVRRGLQATTCLLLAIEAKLVRPARSIHGTAMRYVALLIVASSLISTVHAAQPFEGVAAVVNKEVITVAEVRAITKEAEEKAARELSGDALRTKIAKIRLAAINALVEQKR